VLQICHCFLLLTNYVGYLLANVATSARVAHEHMNTRLTASKIAALRPKPNRYRVWDSEIQGFHVRISPKGRKTFVLTYRYEGFVKEITIGTYGNLTIEEARRLAKKLTGQIADNIDVSAQRKAREAEAYKNARATLWRFYSEMYLPWAEANLKSHNETSRTIKSDFKHLLNRNLAAITQWDVQKWASDMQKKRLYSALSARNESKKLARQSHENWASKRKKILKPIISSVYSDYLMPLVLLAINTGMRRGEIFNLHWSDMDLDKRLLTVRGEISKSGYTRHVPLTTEAQRCLNHWGQGKALKGLVFPSPRTGKRLDNIYSAWETLMKLAELDNFRFHDLRHHFASSLVMRGVDLNTVRELLGHRDLKTTLCYAHLAPEHNLSEKKDAR